jgi:ribosomal protein S20
LALGKLEVILSAEDSPKLLPIDNQIRVYSFIGSAEDVKKTVKTVKALLSVNKIQEARELLSTLQSEIDVGVVNLPLATYPDALKLASKHILEGKTKEAKEILKLALSTFTEVHQIIPLSLINTNHLVSLASDVAKKDKELALKYLKGASDELDKSEALGYISESSTTYNELHKLIEEVEKEIKGPNKAEKLFKDLSEKLKEFKEKIFSEENKNSSK